MIQIKLHPRDVGFSGFLTPKAAVDFIISAACTDAERKGIGMEAINNLGHAWVLSGLAVEFISLPKVGTTMYVDTWIEKMNRIYSYRNFEISDQQGNLIMKATTNWSLIDINERRLANITKILDHKSITNQRAIDLKPVERILTIESEKSDMHKVVYSDIDMNNHATSSKYVEWVCDVVEDPFEKLHNVKRLDVSFVNEVRLGQDVVIEQQKEDDKYIYLLKKECGDVVCNVIMTF